MVGRHGGYINALYGAFSVELLSDVNELMVLGRIEVDGEGWVASDCDEVCEYVVVQVSKSGYVLVFLHVSKADPDLEDFLFWGAEVPSITEFFQSHKFVLLIIRSLGHLIL